MAANTLLHMYSTRGHAQFDGIIQLADRLFKNWVIELAHVIVHFSEL